MTRLYFKEMTMEQLTKVYHNCESVREEVRNYMLDNANEALNDVLRDCPKECSYQIATYCQGEHFRIAKPFFNATADLLDRVDAWINRNEFTFYRILDDTAFLEECAKMRKYLEVIDTVENIKNKDYEFMWTFIMDTMAELEDRIYKALMELYEDNISEEECLLYFCDEFGLNSFEDYYVEDGNVYKEVHYVNNLTKNAKGFDIFA